MTDNPSVNRSLPNKTMDHIDHALGRPVDPLGETYREYFATDSYSELAIEFRASPYWEEGVKTAPGRMAYFYVTPAGRQALAEHLKGIGDPYKKFAVTFAKQDTIVAAETHAKARAAHYRTISDLDPDLTFQQFCEQSSVHLVKSGDSP